MPGGLLSRRGEDIHSLKWIHRRSVFPTRYHTLSISTRPNGTRLIALCFVAKSKKWASRVDMPSGAMTTGPQQREHMAGQAGQGRTRQDKAGEEWRSTNDSAPRIA